MQIFVMGATKVGKTTAAKLIQQALAEQDYLFELYEAGGWARQEFAKTQAAANFQDELDPAFKNALTEFAMARLREEPMYSLDAYRRWRYLSESQNVIIAGVRNPDDFVCMLSTEADNVVVQLVSDQPAASGSLGVFEKGLGVIEAYLEWKALTQSRLLQCRVRAADLADPTAMVSLLNQILEFAQPASRPEFD